MRWKSTSGPLTDGGNSVQIVILPQTGKKIYQNFGSEFGALLRSTKFRKSILRPSAVRVDNKFSFDPLSAPEL